MLNHVFKKGKQHNTENLWACTKLLSQLALNITKDSAHESALLRLLNIVTHNSSENTAPTGKSNIGRLIVTLHSIICIHGNYYKHFTQYLSFSATRGTIWKQFISHIITEVQCSNTSLQTI